MICCLANGLVSRETVAEVQIEKNESAFAFLRGKTVLQLWPGLHILSIRETR